MTREEAKRFWLIRYENAKDFSDPHWEAQERREHREYVEALAMATEALSAKSEQTIRHIENNTKESDLVYRPSAEAVQQSEQYMKGVEDTKRAFLLAYARKRVNMRKQNAQLEAMLNAYRAISAEAVEIVPCKDCKWEFICRQTVEQANTDDVEHRPLEWCSYGERKGGEK